MTEELKPNEEVIKYDGGNYRNVDLFQIVTILTAKKTKDK